MKLDIVMGRALQAAGRLFQLWGGLIGDEQQRLRGYQLVAVGQMRVLGAQAAALIRYCTPRQALGLQPILHGERRPGPVGR